MRTYVRSLLGSAVWRRRIDRGRRGWILGPRFGRRRSRGPDKTRADMPRAAAQVVGKSPPTDEPRRPGGASAGLGPAAITWAVVSASTATPASASPRETTGLTLLHMLI